ncbi:MAG: DUF885 domain-containing protein [Alphaproteobacteria bacterium]|nr:DUF885 domain-containing protein [Alphaproteobacteria bacterium]
MKKIIWALVLAFMLTVTARAQTTSQIFNKILADHWAQRLAENPAFAARLGYRKYDGRLAQNTAEARARRRAYNVATLARLDKINVTDLDRKSLLNYRIFRRERVMEQQGYAHPGYLFLLTNREGWHMSFAQNPSNMAFLKVADYDNYLGQLADYPRFNNENIAVLQQAVNKGYTQYCQSMKGYATSISSHIVTAVKKSVFYGPFTRFPATIPQAKRQQITRRGVALIMEKVIPAYAKFYQFYTKIYNPACRKTAGISSVKGGAAYYNYLIRKFTTTDLTAAQIHRIGLREVKRLHGEMAKIIKQVKFTGTFSEFITFLRTDPRFYAKSPGELLERAALIVKRMDGKLPQLFGVLPRTPYGIKEIPADIAQKTTAAYYMPSNGDGRTAGYYYLNTSLLNSRPLYTLEALSFHEAVPGHHLQISLQQEMAMPMFRKYADFTAFVEGWALYAEKLGLDAGFYRDPYSNFGRLSYEMWRAVRLVVDTGLHAMNWTRQQAIDYMMANTSLSRHNIVTEVDRYITWPGQALAYKIGELSISALRQKAEKTLGGKFDLLAFNDTVLKNGALPINLLQDEVNDWIRQQAPNPRTPNH